MKYHIDEYNKLHPDKRKPYILLAIDEVAMLQDEKECMTIIEKYRQLVGVRCLSYAIDATSRCKSVRW